MVKVIYEDLEEFTEAMRKEEKTDRTIEQYNRYIKEFIEQTKINSKEDIDKDLLIDYKAYLTEKHKGNLNSINNKVVIINKFVTYLKLPSEFKLKEEKQQKQTTLENVLTLKEYDHLREYAKEHHQDQLYYIMGVLEGTGIRISELQYITLDAVKKQEVNIKNKGKLRRIPIQDRVKKELLTYCKEQGITEGIIFKSRYGNPLDSAYIWRQLQKLARTS